MRSKVIPYTIFPLALFAIAAYGLYKWLIDGELRWDSFIYFALVGAYFLDYLTEPDTEGKTEGEGKHSSSKVSTISYLVLVVVIGSMLFISEGTGRLSELDNVPLVLCFSLSLVILPIVRWVVFMKNR
ncbi:hypothetical protein U0355_09260 [Salimicrobium sp. PL1-032A]|uniref:hypothetical protein n=1 Tax=Salimicrobium sp. PL1-032A TaxID=3095364 RepID=UPI003261A398